MPRKKKTNDTNEKELAKAGFKSNEKPKSDEEIEIERLLSLGKVNGNNKG